MTDTYVIDQATGKAVIGKDPNAVLDFPFDWSAWLAGVSDTLQAATYTVSGGGVLDRQTISATVSTPWISGGVSGSTIKLSCRVTTIAGRTDERTVYIKVKDR